MSKQQQDHFNSFKLVNLFFGNPGAKGRTKKPHRVQVTISLTFICVQKYFNFCKTALIVALSILFRLFCCVQSHSGSVCFQF